VLWNTTTFLGDISISLKNTSQGVGQHLHLGKKPFPKEHQHFPKEQIIFLEEQKHFLKEDNPNK
jgi:hypothetical protein